MKAQITFCTYTDESHEGQNNSLHLSGQLEGNHRLDLLLLPFLPSREEKEVGARGAKPPRKPQQTSYAYQTNKMKAKTSLCAYSAELHEGRNNFLHPSGRLDGNHRMNPLIIHLHSSIRETKCGVYSRTLRLRFSKLLSTIQRTK